HSAKASSPCLRRVPISAASRASRSWRKESPQVRNYRDTTRHAHHSTHPTDSPPLPPATARDPRRMPRRDIVYADAFLEDFNSLDAFERPRIRTAILVLADQAEVLARNRRPLSSPISWCPEATWQLRVGEYRVLYRVDPDGVYVL